MKAPVLVIRCDAGFVPEIGTGHVVRSIRLARQLCGSGVLAPGSIVFVTSEGGDFSLGLDFLKKSNFPVISENWQVLKANSDSEIQYLKSLNASVILMDRLDTTSKLIVSLQKAGSKVITFDDKGTGRNVADLAVNAIFNDVPDGSNLLKGYKYLILSGREYKPTDALREVNRICVSFGGFDERDLASFFLDNLSRIKYKIEIDLILGRSNHCDKSQLLSKVEMVENAGGIRIHETPDDFHDIASKADIAVVSGGLTIFEFAAHGIPTISIPQYLHQLETIRKLESLGITLLGSAGMDIDSGVFLMALDRLVKSYELRKTMSLEAVNYVDGLGCERVSKAVAKVLSLDM